MRLITAIILLFALSSCGFRPMLAKDNASSAVLSTVKIIAVEGPDKLRLKRIIEESFEPAAHANSCYDLKINIATDFFSMGIMTDSQVTRYRVNITLNYNLLDPETKKTLDASAISLRSSYDSESSDFANYIAQRTVSDNILHELTSELKTRLILVISELEKNGKTCR